MKDLRDGTLQSPGATSTIYGDTLARLGPWFHNLHLPDGTQTAPGHPLGDFPAFKWRALAPCLPADLRGKTVLDVGCNAGFYCFAMAACGAEVLGVDADPHYLEQARWAQPHLDPHGRTRFAELSAYELDQLDQQFDIVLFMGVFYHLRHPVRALDLAVARTKEWLVFQSLTLRDGSRSRAPQPVAFEGMQQLNAADWPRMAFIEDRLAGDPTNWWIPNLACVEALLRSCDLRIVARPAHEILVCRRADAEPSP